MRTGLTLLHTHNKDVMPAALGHPYRYLPVRSMFVRTLRVLSILLQG